MIEVFVLGGGAALVALLVASDSWTRFYAKGPQADVTCRFEPAIPQTLRFGIGELAQLVRQGHPVVAHPDVAPAVQAALDLGGSLWFDGRTLSWRGPAMREVQARQELEALTQAIHRVVHAPWLALQSLLDLDGDWMRLDGIVDGIGVRIAAVEDGGTVACRLGYGDDGLVVRRVEGPGDTAIGDPILDRLHLEGPPEALARLKDDAVREELMALVHGLGGSVERGVVRFRRPRAELKALIEDLDHALTLCRRLRGEAS